MIIVGSGPAGLTAGIYASRYGIKNLIIGDKIGGMLGEIPTIENYPGFEKITGFELAMKMHEHALSSGSEFVQATVHDIEKREGKFIVRTSAGEFEAKAIILATGVTHKKLGIPGEVEYKGKGVSYCATCDAPFFKDKVVAVIGGANTALMDAFVLSQVAKKVYMVVRSYVKGEKVWRDRVLSQENVEIVKGVPVEIKGNTKVRSLVIESEGERRELEVDGIFIAIGLIPIADLARKIGVEIEGEHIKVDEAMHTNVEGVFAAGDVTTGSARLKQIITAAAEGAIAATSVLKFLRR